MLLKSKDHKNVWLKCSGAHSRMKMNPGYYEAIKFTNLKYPHPGPSDVEKDLLRPGENISLSDINSMRNVLCAYVIRNPTVGYC